MQFTNLRISVCFDIIFGENISQTEILTGAIKKTAGFLSGGFLVIYEYCDGEYDYMRIF